MILLTLFCFCAVVDHTHETVLMWRTVMCVSVALATLFQMWHVRRLFEQKMQQLQKQSPNANNTNASSSSSLTSSTSSSSGNDGGGGGGGASSAAAGTSAGNSAVSAAAGTNAAAQTSTPQR
jgi:uncharacterized membrane protein YgcG